MGQRDKIEGKGNGFYLQDKVVLSQQHLVLHILQRLLLPLDYHSGGKGNYISEQSAQSVEEKLFQMVKSNPFNPFRWQQPQEQAFQFPHNN